MKKYELSKNRTKVHRKLCQIMNIKLCKRCKYSVKSYQRLEKLYILFPCLVFSTLGKRVGVKRTMLPDGQPQTVAFTVLAQLRDPKANETEDAALLTINGEGRNFDFFR